MTAEPTMLEPGDKFGDYEVVAAIGCDGFVSRYVARRRAAGGFANLVTLLLVHATLNEDRVMLRIVLERARTFAAVVHPNVARVEDIGRRGGIYYLAMEYVHGVSLAALMSRLSERQLPPHRKLCVWLAGQTAEALAAVHEASGLDGRAFGSVHGELRPSNILLSQTGHLKLVDFGDADLNARTPPAGIMGKLRYKAPEQLACEHCDQRSDIYALGVMLWEMLTGRRFLTSLAGGIEGPRASHETLGPPGRYSIRSSPAIDRVVQRAIARQPEQRPDTALRFRALLLQAEPAALRVSAPEIAAFVRWLFGNELEQRRARWPADLADPLEPTTNITASQRWSVDDLTTNFVDRVLPPGPDIAVVGHREQPEDNGGFDYMSPTRLMSRVQQAELLSHDDPSVARADACSPATPERCPSRGRLCSVCAILGLFLSPSPVDAHASARQSTEADASIEELLESRSAKAGRLSQAAERAVRSPRRPGDKLFQRPGMIQN